MIAVVKVGGHQAIVTVGETIEVDKLNAEVGKKVSLETLLISEEDGKNFQLGTPLLSETVEAKVIEHGRGSKIRVFKMKPRKRYRRTQGHRQDYTAIEITKIGGAAAPAKKAPVKKEAAPKTEKKTPAKKAAPKKPAAKPAAKKAAAKKAEK